MEGRFGRPNLYPPADGAVRQVGVWVWAWKAVPAYLEYYPEELRGGLVQGWRQGYFARVQIASGQVFVPYSRYARRPSPEGMEIRRALWLTLQQLGAGARVLHFDRHHMLVEQGGRTLRVGALVTPTSRPSRRKLDLLAVLSGSGGEHLPRALVVPLDPFPPLWEHDLSDYLWLRIAPLILEGHPLSHRYTLRQRLNTALALHYGGVAHREIPHSLYLSAWRMKVRLRERGIWTELLDYLRRLKYEPALAD